VGPNTGTDEGYSVALGDLWTGLADPLARLEGAASDPERLDQDDASYSLRRLQYALHLAAEHAYGLEPPPDAASAHAELADALRSARDATASVAEAVSVRGAGGAESLLHQWRGALFRVRLARMRLATPRAAPPGTDDSRRDGLRQPFLAFVLALAGALAFVVGATLQLWPLWVAGLFAVCCSVGAYRPS
jgi:hypothetical protein